MTDDRMRNRDLVLPPRTQAFVLDTTKGKVSVYVGPSKTSLSETDKIVTWDGRKRQFVPTDDHTRAVTNWAEAGEGQYIVLSDPAKDAAKTHPLAGTSVESIDLNVGCKVVIPGPCTFPLWPGQTAETIDGHRMATNQYVVVRVSQPTEATSNWDDAAVSAVSTDKTRPDLEMGQLIIIKGTDVSYYIPSTGLEVVPDEEGNFVRSAVTLEQLEYSILLDESGEKRYVRGPSVVFPEPTEAFIVRNGQRKFQAIELNDQSGIYVKVTAPYEEDGKKYNAGEELFITGKESAFYFPRAEHNVIKYGNQIKHHAIAIPEGEGRYVLNRKTGTVSIVKGPKMYLPNPVEEVVVKRILEKDIVEIMYPGNRKAIEVNQVFLLQAEQVTSNGTRLTSGGFDGTRTLACSTAPVFGYSANVDTSEIDPKVFGDRKIERGTSYTEPRTVTLDTKYEGAVSVNVWPGYAVMVMDKVGNRRVEIGPKSILLEYDESLAVLELSTGKPKNSDSLFKTCYLRTVNNTISDIVSVETSDLVPVQIRLSYRVNFEGTDNKSRVKWFDVENYVKVLTDHCRSRLRNIAKQHTIQDFFSNAIPIIRDNLLGVKPTDGKRPGLVFEQNNMKLYDVEILKVGIEDSNVAKLLGSAVYDTLQGVIQVTREKEKATQVKTIEELKRQSIAEQERTKQAEQETALASLTRKYDLEQADSNIAEQRREQSKADADLALEMLKQKNGVELARMQAETELLKARMEAMSPAMVSAISEFGDKMFAERLTTSIAPAALAAGITTAEMLEQIFKDTPYASALAALNKKPSQR